MYYRPFLLFLMLSCGLIWGAETGSAAPAESADPAALALHLMDYIRRDYPLCVQGGQVINETEYQEQLELLGEFQTILKQLPPKAHHDALLKHARHLETLLNNKDAGSNVWQEIGRFETLFLKDYPIPQSPPPGSLDLKRAQKLYQEQCAGCHGATGNGRGAWVQDIPGPPPADLTDPQRNQSATLWGIQQSIRYGVKGTAMAAFPGLSEADRWALAAYVLQMSHPFSPAALFALTQKKLDESLEYYKQGHWREAKQAAISAYLDGFEPLEAPLDTRDQALRQTLEENMMQYRALIHKHRPVGEVESVRNTLMSQLEQAQIRIEGTPYPAFDQFLSAFIILLREGLEAILVLAAILSVLRKVNAEHSIKYVHAGWILALIAGVITCFAAQSMIQISGASRELTEGVTAFIAAITLVWVGIWLHGHAQGQKWQSYIKRKIQYALDADHAIRTAWGLGFIAFLSVYREAFEILLFYQALWFNSDQHQPFFWGIFAAILCLGLLVWAVFRISARLPLRQFFQVSAWLISILALIFTGKGAKALQEADLLSQTVTSYLPHVSLVGLYPNWESFGLQLLAFFVLFFGFRMTRQRSEKTD